MVGAHDSPLDPQLTAQEAHGHQEDGAQGHAEVEGSVVNHGQVLLIENVEHAGRERGLLLLTFSLRKPLPLILLPLRNEATLRGRPHRKPPWFVRLASGSSAGPLTTDAQSRASQTCILYQGFAHVPNPFCFVL